MTEAGKSFYAYALHIVDSFGAAGKKNAERDALGVLRIGTSVTIGNFMLPKAILKLRQMYPALKIKATVSNGANLQKALLHNDLDFAAIEGPIDEPLLHADCFAEDQLIPVLSPDSEFQGAAVTLEELVQAPLLLREHGSAGRIFLDHIFAIHGISPEPILESVSTQAILQAVHMGLGISFLPEQLAGPSVRSGFVSTCSVIDECFHRENYLVWHQQKYLTNSAKEMMEIFRSFSQPSDSNLLLQR